MDFELKALKLADAVAQKCDAAGGAGHRGFRGAAPTRCPRLVEERARPATSRSSRASCCRPTVRRRGGARVVLAGAGDGAGKRSRPRCMPRCPPCAASGVKRRGRLPARPTMPEARGACRRRRGGRGHLRLPRTPSPSAEAPRAAARDHCCGRQGGGRKAAFERHAARPAASSWRASWANRPGNHCTPTFLADEAKTAGQGARPPGRGAGPQGGREARHGLLPGRGAGLGGAAALHRAAVPRRGQVRGAGGAGGQGHHLRHRRHLDQAGGRDGRDEVRHGRRRQRAGHLARGGRAQAGHQRGGPDPGLREHARRPRRQAGRRGHQHERADHRDPQHRRRGPPDPVRRADLCRALQAARRWSTSPR